MPIVLAPLDTELMVLKIVANQDIKRHLEDLGIIVRRRLFDMGVTPGAEVLMRKKAPLGDPLEINIRSYELTLRKVEASCVTLEVIDEKR